LPASVAVSRRPCDAAARKVIPTSHHHLLLSRDGSEKNARQTKKLRTPAKRSECENPRCPRGCAYGMPSEKAMTSRSGTIAIRTRIKRTFQRGGPAGATCVNAPPTNACVNTVGNFRFPPHILNLFRPIPSLKNRFYWIINKYLKLCNKFSMFVKRTGVYALTLTFARQCPMIGIVC